MRHKIVSAGAGAAALMAAAALAFAPSAQASTAFRGLATFFAPIDPQAADACGGHFNESANIVALNVAQFGNSAVSRWCGKKVKVSIGGKTITATVEDRCTLTCSLVPGFNGIGLSQKDEDELGNPADPPALATWTF
jgi:hypothetical protein